MSTDLSSSKTPSHILELFDLIANVQKLGIKAYQSNDLKELISIMVTDTNKIVGYNRAILISKNANHVHILGEYEGSSPTLSNDNKALVKQLVQDLSNLHDMHILSPEDFPTLRDKWVSMQAERHMTVFWVPIVKEHEELFLWLERIEDPNAPKYFGIFAPIIKDFLVPAYAAAWQEKKAAPIYREYFSKLNLKRLGLFLLTLLISLFLIPIQLRIVAPCEVVAKDPYVVTAPMEGIIKNIKVSPGEMIHKDQLLFTYDEKLPFYRYQSALKNVDLLQTELNRAYVLGLGNEDEISNLALLDLKLKKSEIELAFAKQQLNLATDKAPIDGLVSITNPEEWQGKPVKIGEKILTISNPERTKLKIFIPEKDNLTFPKDHLISVFLNAFPEHVYEAKLLYISSEAKYNQEQLPVFEADAEWTDPTEHPKLGLKGSAVLYGEKVSLFYYILRKPIAYTRKLFGI